jgi:hypothetical protein
MEPEDRTMLREMKGKIDGIEKLALELKTLGEGLPVIDRNTRNILSATYCLKFGISDVADVLGEP